MIMYIDLIFVLNFVIDTALLYAVASTLKLQVQRKRIAISSFIGASYVVMIFFPKASFLFTFLFKIVISLVMVWVAFGFISIQYYLRCVSAFYFVHFIAAGGIYGVYYVLNGTNEVINGMLYVQTGSSHVQIGLLFFTFVFTAILLFYKNSFRIFTRAKQFQQYIAEVHVYFNRNHSICQGLIDTGNRLVDPLTKSPVMILEVEQWEHLLPQSLLECIRTSDVSGLLDQMSSGNGEWNDRIRLVPYRSVNRDSQFMLALKPDKVVVFHQATRFETEKVLVGLEGGKLSSDGTYTAIIHPQLVEHAV